MNDAVRVQVRDSLREVDGQSHDGGRSRRSTGRTHGLREDLSGLSVDEVQKLEGAPVLGGSDGVAGDDSGMGCAAEDTMDFEELGALLAGLGGQLEGIATGSVRVFDLVDGPHSPLSDVSNDPVGANLEVVVGRSLGHQRASSRRVRGSVIVAQS